MNTFNFLIIIVSTISIFPLSFLNNIYGCQLLDVNQTASEIQKDIIFAMIAHTDYQINSALNPFFSSFMTIYMQSAIRTLENLSNILDEISQFQPIEELEQAKEYLQASTISLKQGDLFNAKTEISNLNSTINSIMRDVC